MTSPSQATALLASACIFLSTSRKRHHNRSFITSCSALNNEDTSFTSSPTTSIVSLVPSHPSIESVYHSITIHAEVARRLSDLLLRCAVVITKYKYFYYRQGKKPHDSLSGEQEQQQASQDTRDENTIRKYNEEDKKELSDIHQQAANSMFKACVSHGGLLIKMGQYISNMSGIIPKEYTEALRPLQDSCSIVPLNEIRQIIQSELSKCGFKKENDVFDNIEKEPLGSASLAQVHAATLKDGSRVAVKVQRPNMELNTKADLVALEVLSKIIEMMFPGAGFEWMLPEFHQSIAAELDFTQEAVNMERCSKMLQNSNLMRKAFLWDLFSWSKMKEQNVVRAIIPTPIKELTTSRMLIMSFESGFKITDVQKIHESSINPSHVASATCNLFGELMYIHGFVHADPHPGNILIRPRQQNQQQQQHKGSFDLVLLDHGMYRRLDDDFRRNYCQLWAGLVSNDMNQAEKAVECMGLNKKYLDFLGLMLVYKLPPSGQKLGTIMSRNKRKELRDFMKQKYGEEMFSTTAASTFMESLPRDLLFCLRCTNLVRGINRELHGTSLDRFMTFGGAAAKGVKLSIMREEEKMEKDSLTGNVLEIAKRKLNRPVASEFLSDRRYGLALQERRLIRNLPLDVLRFCTVSWRVWYQCLLVDLMIWWSGKSSDASTMQLG